MAEFKIDGRMTVRKLKEIFKNEFEGTLRVYDGRELADDKATLASIRKGDAKGGEFVCRASRTVGKFEQEMKEVFGIRVQVASPDDYILALDGITLANLKNIKEKATKADMEELVAYKRNSNCECDKKEEDSSNERLTIKQYIKTLEYVFERFDMIDMDGSYFTEWGTLDELFDDNQIDEALENAWWPNENNEDTNLEETGYEYRDEVSDEIMEEFVSLLALCLDQGEIKSLTIRDGDKILHEESNDEPYLD